MLSGQSVLDLHVPPHKPLPLQITPSEQSESFSHVGTQFICQHFLSFGQSESSPHILFIDIQNAIIVEA